MDISGNYLSGSLPQNGAFRFDASLHLARCLTAEQQQCRAPAPCLAVEHAALEAICQHILQSWASVSLLGKGVHAMHKASNTMQHCEMSANHAS